MPFYTFIMDYDGGSYTSQVRAPSTKAACVKWARELEIDQMAGIGARSKVKLVEDMKEETPTPLAGRLNVWCATALIRGRLALISIVRTEA
jgi:hypothetical protein